MAVTLRVKYLGIDVEYNVPHSEDYSLSALFADVYIMACSEIPHADEKFKLKVKLAWTGEYRLIEDERDLRDVFLVLKCRGFKAIRMHLESLPLTAVPHPSDHVPPPHEPGSEEGEPYESYSTNQSMPNIVCISFSEEHNDVAAEQRTSAGAEECSDSKDEDYLPESDSGSNTEECLDFRAESQHSKYFFEVGSSSSQSQNKKKKKTVTAQLSVSQPQRQKKKKKQIVPAKPPASQPESTSQSVSVSQPLQCSQPLSHNAPTDQPTQVISIIVFNIQNIMFLKSLLVINFLILLII
ncbi:hypothetical protein ACOSQ2_022179 [Xanthoceras sorbifolium]